MEPEKVRASVAVLRKFSPEELDTYIGIGFCQPKFYLPSAWRKAKKLMEIACSFGWAKPFDFGRGCGKYISDLDISEVKMKIQDLRLGMITSGDCI